MKIIQRGTYNIFRVRLIYKNFTFVWPCIVTNFFIIKPTRCTNFTNSFCHEILLVSDSFSAHHQEFTHCTLNNVIQVFRHLSSRIELSSILVLFESCLQHIWHIPLLSVQWINSWWWTKELSETCRISWQNEFVKLVQLVGFIIKKLLPSCTALHPRIQEPFLGLSHLAARNHPLTRIFMSNLLNICQSWTPR